MMHTERKSPWVRGEVPGKESTPKPGQERLRGMSFDEGEKSLAPRPEAPPQPRLPSLSDREKQAKEEGDKVGAFFAKKKAKARAKKVRKHQGKVESSRAKFDEAKQALVARLHVAFSGARAALEVAIAQIRSGLEQVGANPPDMALIGESVEKGLSNALIEMIVPESGIRRPD